MAFRSGTTTSATPSTALITEIEAEMTTHGNWDFVEEVVIGTSTYRVWRNRGTGTGANSFGSDFHVALIRPTDGTGNLTVKVFEAYDATTDRLFRPCTPNTSNLTPNANYSVGDQTTGYTLDNTAPTVSATVLLVTTGYDWFLQVNANFFVVGVKYSTTDTGVYAGLFEPLMAGEPFPLCLVATNGQESIYATDTAVSRHPNMTTTNADNFAHRCDAFTKTGGDPQRTDLFHNGAFASRVLVHAHGTPSQTYGYARGLLYGCAYLPDGTTVTRTGDTITIGGVTYTKYRIATFGLSAGVFVSNAVA